MKAIWFVSILRVFLAFFSIYFRKRIVEFLSNQTDRLIDILKIPRADVIASYRKEIKNIVKFFASVILFALATCLLLFRYTAELDSIIILVFKIILALNIHKIILLAINISEDYIIALSETWDWEDSEKKKLKTILPFSTGLIKYLVHIVLAGFLVSLVGVDISPFLNFGLVLTGVLGYALQPLLQDFTGVFRILSENLYKEGDYVKLFLDTEIELEGKILKISPLYTYLLCEDNLIIVPNRQIGSVVKNSITEHSKKINIQE